MADTLGAIFAAGATRAVAVIAHELAHYLAARLTGHRATISIGYAGLGVSSTSVPNIESSPGAAQLVRHAGWLFSLALAASFTLLHGLDSVPALVLWLVAAEAIASDGFAWCKGDSRFFCGNFGLMLLDSLAAPLVKEILATMLRVTMMRGAQSAGLVTYQGQVGVRKRVCNGKRTDLCKLLMAKFDAQVRPAAVKARSLFQGHTRFATSSIANLGGCHPHQWLPARRVVEWRRDPAKGGQYASRSCNHECYITHNGDLDFYELHEDRKSVV